MSLSIRILWGSGRDLSHQRQRLLAPPPPTPTTPHHPGSVSCWLGARLGMISAVRASPYMAVGFLKGHPKTRIPGGWKLPARPVRSYIWSRHAIPSTAYDLSRHSWGPSRVKVGEEEHPQPLMGSAEVPLQGASGMGKGVAATFGEHHLPLSVAGLG